MAAARERLSLVLRVFPGEIESSNITDALSLSKGCFSSGSLIENRKGQPFDRLRAAEF
jgi:hypothetical protein